MPLKYNNQEFDVSVKSYMNAPLAMCVQLNDHETKEPYATLTVCLGNYQSEYSFVQHGCSFIDVNNLPFAQDLLEKTGLAEPYTKFGSVVEMQSGWVSYPVYQFNQDMLKELDPKGFEQYTKDWWKECQKEQTKIEDELFGSLQDQILDASAQKSDTSTLDTPTKEQEL